VVFLAGFVGFGIWQSRYNRSAEDYFLGRRKIPWVVAMFSIVATETSVLTFVSVPGLAYRGDWFFLQLALGYILGRILVAVFLLPQYYTSGVTSIYEVLGTRFGPAVQKCASALFLLTRVLADSVRFLCTAVVIQAVTGWSLTAAVLLIGLVTLTYTLIGGIRTVLWVDSFQFLLYLFTAVLTIAACIIALNASVFELLGDLLEAGKLKVFHFSGNVLFDSTLAVSGVLGGLFLSFASHGADHMMVQRALACRDLRSARWAMVGSGLFVFLQFGLFLLVGSMLYLLFSGEELEIDREYATFINLNFLHSGLKGLVVAGVLSAAMSTLSSSINALASSTIMDWMKKDRSLKRSWVVSIFWAAVLITVALVFDESDEALVIVGIQIASITYGGLLGLFLLSRWKRKFRTASLITGLIGSLVVVVIIWQCGVAWTWFVVAGTATNLMMAYATDFILDSHGKK
jgi:SSS family transporter